MLYYVESGVESYIPGDEDMPLFRSFLNAFTKALQLFEEDNVLKNYKDRIEKVLDNAGKIGYGFDEAMDDIYIQFDIE